MAKKQLIIRGATQMPAAIKKLWGPPPVHPSESQEDYWKLAVAMAQAVEPANAIEWIYLKDVADYTWNIRELRKHQAQVIRVAEQKCHENHPKSQAVNARYYATALGKADLFLDRLESFESINKLLEVAESRRTAMLNEIESYRKILASRFRKASDDIIEGDFSEHAPVCGAGPAVGPVSEIVGDPASNITGDLASGANRDGQVKEADPDPDPDPGADNDPTRRGVA
jgi:hypothetical protein